MPPALPLLLLFLTLGAWSPRAAAKSTIEPCPTTSPPCPALVLYTLPTDLKVAEVAALFSADPTALLLANSISISSSPSAADHILPSRLPLRVPVACSCRDGIRKASSVAYRTRPADTLASVSAAVYGGLVTADQIREANPGAGLADPEVIGVGTRLDIPLPCTCFNNSDNGLPAVYLSYVVGEVDTLAGVAARYATTVSDLMNVNELGSVEIEEGDILAIPLSACASNFPSYANDYGLVVPNGSYAITASHCVQCSCGPGSRNLYCMPSPLAVSCSSMQCRNSNLMLGNITTQQSAAGCNVTSCDYSGFVNGSIATTLSTSLQPRCPGPQQFPTLIDPPTVVPESIYSPAPSPLESGGIPSTNPRSNTVPSSGAVLGFPPAGGPAGSVPGSSGACSLTNNYLTKFTVMLVLCLMVKFVLSMLL